MSKMQNDVESFIRHLQSSLDKRKREISLGSKAIEFYNMLVEGFRAEHGDCHLPYPNEVKEAKEALKQLHKEQATETRMLKYFENARSFAKSLERCK